MLIDLILVGILAQAGGVFLGLAAVFVLWRASRSTVKTGAGYVRTSVRFALRAAAAVVLFVVAMTAWNAGERALRSEDDEEPSSARVDENGDLNLNFPPGEGLRVARAVAGLAGADDANDVTRHATTLLTAAQRAGATNRQLRQARSELIGLMGADTTREMIAALDSVLFHLTGAEELEPLTETDSLRLVITELRQDIVQLEARNTRLEQRLEEAEEGHGVRYYLSQLLDDLGVGFGWAAVYFTAFLAMMRGQTPGKRFLGCRVIRLDGKPLGWWMSFERFGGYAASLFLGLLGFAQIIWDRNRQGLHDKACETVVIREMSGQAAAAAK